MTFEDSELVHLLRVRSNEDDVDDDDEEEETEEFEEEFCS